MSNRPTASRRDPDDRAIEQTAAEWFGRCEIGLTPEEEREFVRWLEADVRHGEAMRGMDETWDYLDGLKEIRRKRVSGPLIFAAAAAVGAALIGIWRPWTETPYTRQVSTEADGMKKVELPDGSVVHLNAGSSIDVRLASAVRRVQLLRGEASFEVAKNPARAFVVEAGNVAIKAVGTAFDVRRTPQTVEVLVMEGKVRVDDFDRGESENLAAGERAVVSLAGAATPPGVVVAPVAPAQARRALAWQARQLDFDLTPLSEVVAEFNRYNTHQLVITDAELGRQPFGGSFRADNYGVFVRLLERRFGVVAETRDGATLLHRAK